MWGIGHVEAPECTLELHTSQLRAPNVQRWEAHAHCEHELLWGARGILTAETDDGFFAVPPSLGLWIPAGVEHAVEAAAGTTFYCSYLRLTAPEHLAELTTPVAVSPILRELLLYLRDHDIALDSRRRAEKLAIDVIEPADLHAITVPMPTDPRLAAIAAGLLEHPDDTRSAEQWSREVGASPRHLSRLFRQETGMTFARWRIHARMRAAVRLLAADLPVGAVARRVGYRTPSSFVQVFRQVMGQTPGAYVGNESAPEDTGPRSRHVS